MNFNGGSFLYPRSGITELGRRDYTFSGWFRTSVTGTGILSKESDDPSSASRFDTREKAFVVSQHDSNATMSPSGSVNLVTNEGTINGGKSIADNQWHHVAVTWDAQTQTGSVFIDGVEEMGANRGGFNGREDIFGSHSELVKRPTVIGPLRLVLPDTWMISPFSTVS